MKMMKRIAAGLLTAMLVFSLAACGDKKNNNDGNGDSVKFSFDFDAENGTHNKFDVTVDKFEVVYNEDSEFDNFLMTVTAKNNTKEWTSFIMNVDVVAYQDDHQLDDADLENEDGSYLCDWGSEMEFEAGESATGLYGWSIWDDECNTVKVQFLASGTDTVLGEHEFDISKMHHVGPLAESAEAEDGAE